LENLSHICAAKIEELNKIQNLTTNYNDLRLKLNEWLHEAELKTLEYEPIAVDPDTIERQYDQLQADSSECDLKQNDFTQLNKNGNELIALLSKYDDSNKTTTTYVKKIKHQRNIKEVIHRMLLLLLQIPMNLHY